MLCTYCTLCTSSNMCIFHHDMYYQLPPFSPTAAGASVAECVDLKRQPSGVSTTSVTFLKRPIYMATPANNHETGSNSGDSITGADVEMVDYTPLRSTDVQSGAYGANGRAELLAASPHEIKKLANTGVGEGAPRADRSGTETSV